jgi:enoyl-CoA hydratase
MAYELIEVRTEAGKVGIVTLNRPKQLNALNNQLMDELGAALKSFDADPAIGCMIITGSEKAFAAGADIGAMASWSFTDVYKDDYITRNWETIRGIRKPVIAAVSGFALGGGCELALSCDLRVLAAEARIGLPETKLGAIAGAGGVQKLVRHVGRSKALEWILLARQIDAATAAQYGLTTAVVPRDEVLATAIALARELRALGPQAIAQSKATIYTSEDADLRTARRYGLDALSMLVGSAELRDGMRALVNKRAPGFDAW